MVDPLADAVVQRIHRMYVGLCNLRYVFVRVQLEVNVTTSVHCRAAGSDYCCVEQENIYWNVNNILHCFHDAGRSGRQFSLLTCHSFVVAVLDIGHKLSGWRAQRIHGSWSRCSDIYDGGFTCNAKVYYGDGVPLCACYRSDFQCI
jgi:hypothetical protein